MKKTYLFVQSFLLICGLLVASAGQARLPDTPQNRARVQAIFQRLAALRGSFGYDPAVPLLSAFSLEDREFLAQILPLRAIGAVILDRPAPQGAPFRASVNYIGKSNGRYLFMAVWHTTRMNAQNPVAVEFGQLDESNFQVKARVVGYNADDDITILISDPEITPDVKARLDAIEPIRPGTVPLDRALAAHPDAFFAFAGRLKTASIVGDFADYPGLASNELLNLWKSTSVTDEMKSNKDAQTGAGDVFGFSLMSNVGNGRFEYRRDPDEQPLNQPVAGAGFLASPVTLAPPIYAMTNRFGGRASGSAGFLVYSRGGYFTAEQYGLGWSMGLPQQIRGADGRILPTLRANPFGQVGIAWAKAADGTPTEAQVLRAEAPLTYFVAVPEALKGLVAARTLGLNATDEIAGIQAEDQKAMVRFIHSLEARPSKCGSFLRSILPFWRR